MRTLANEHEQAPNAAIFSIRGFMAEGVGFEPTEPDDRLSGLANRRNVPQLPPCPIAASPESMRVTSFMRANHSRMCRHFDDCIDDSLSFFSHSGFSGFGVRLLRIRAVVVMTASLPGNACEYMANVVRWLAWPRN